jgi:hypothetical protein
VLENELASTESAESAKQIAKARTICKEWAKEPLQDQVLQALKQILIKLDDGESRKRKRDGEDGDT